MSFPRYYLNNSWVEIANVVIAFMNEEQEHINPEDENTPERAEESQESNDAEREPAYAAKPFAAARNSDRSRTMLSLVLFVGLFYLWFGDLRYVILLLGIIFIHEIGHLTAMRIFGYKELSMLFIPMLGAVVSGEKDRVSQRQRSIILMAGPMPGIVIGSILIVAALQMGNESMGQAGALFIMVNVFNLLPFVPLDGGRLIETLFFANKEVIKSIFLGLSALAFLAYAYFAQQYFFILFGVLWFSRVRQENRLKQIRSVLDERGIDYQKSFEELSDREYWQIRRAFLEHPRTFNIGDPNDFRPVRQEAVIMAQVKLVLLTPMVLDMRVGEKVLWTLFWAMFLVLPVLGMYYLFSSSLVGL